MNDKEGSVFGFDLGDEGVLSTGVFGFDVGKGSLMSTGVNGYTPDLSFHEQQKIHQAEYDQEQIEKERAEKKALRKYNSIIILRLGGLMMLFLFFTFICRMAQVS